MECSKGQGDTWSTCTCPVEFHGHPCSLFALGTPDQGVYIHIYINIYTSMCIPLYVSELHAFGGVQSCHRFVLFAPKGLPGFVGYVAMFIVFDHSF